MILENYIVVGGGVAGLVASLTLVKHGKSVDLVSDMPSERAESCLAEGGINAAVGSDDSPELHAQDTLKSGCFLADETAVYRMTRAAPRIIRMLDRIGCVFIKDANLAFVPRAFGGQSRKRTVHAKNGVGKQLMDALIRKVNECEWQGKVIRYTGGSFTKLIIQDGHVCGIWIKLPDRRKLIPLWGQVIMACGGLNGFFSNTTGSLQNTGEAAASLFADGVPFSNLEFIQYHPTTIPLQGKNMMVSEAARGEGGRLFIEKNGKPFYFMEEKYPERGNLMSRDVITKEECLCEKAGFQVYLDLRHLSPEIFQNKLSNIVNECRTFAGIDPVTQPIPVAPGIHYFHGGIKIDKDHRAGIAGLYAAGECAAQYHGANRLGGNSLLGACYGGYTAAKTAMRTFIDITPASDIVPPIFGKNYSIQYLQSIMSRAMIPMRNKSQLTMALRELDSLPDEWDMKFLAKAMVLSALRRAESRGSHLRSDFPELRKEFQKNSVIRMQNGKLKLSWDSVSGESAAFEQELKNAIKVTILRRQIDSPQPYFQTFLYTGEDRVTVAEFLSQLNRQNNIFDAEGNEADPVAWECACLQKRCGACAMRINGKTGLACAVSLQDAADEKREVRLEPLRNFPVETDLRVKRTIIYHNVKKTKLWLSEKDEDTGENDIDLQFESGRCMMCGCCMDVCPVFKKDSIFLGPVLIPYASKVLDQNRKDDHSREISELFKVSFFDKCCSCFACQKVCPAHLPLEKMLKKIKSNMI